ncbi:Aste57867_11849 [Aphanomyces stellatus]|uniref:Aste57867_11849 protein n=1 Tax=Aphanomyces stellatus TaxID=120398 RepID=A0A485KU40_9STRA|nr:hypothetical protein As57867_011804 [Aphanomyces stellatus]VFT88704.1 Aste57867_11849 [Aphanomyces stellatus]
MMSNCQDPDIRYNILCWASLTGQSTHTPFWVEIAPVSILTRSLYVAPIEAGSFEASEADLPRTRALSANLMDFLRRLQHKAAVFVDSTQPRAKKSASPSADHADGKTKFMDRIHDMATAPLDATLEESVTTLVQAKSVDLLHTHSSMVPHTSARPSFAFLHEKQATIRVYEATHAHRYIVKGVTTMPGSVFDILSALQLHGDAFAGSMQEVFGLYFDQGVTLHTTRDRTTDSVMNDDDTTDLDPLGVHWMTLKTSRAMGHDTEADVVFASFSQMYEPAAVDDDDDASSLVATRKNSPLVTCGTHVWESIDLRALAAFPSAVTGRRRLAFRNCGVYVEKVRTPSHADLTSIALVLSFDLDVFMAADRRASALWMQRLVHGVQNISRMARHDSRTILPKHKWTLDGGDCSLCDLPFTLFRRRHHCRLCGHTICHACSCSMDVEFPVMNDGRILNHATVRSCTKCAFIGSTMQRVPRSLDGMGRSVPPQMWSSAPGRRKGRRATPSTQKARTRSWRDSDETVGVDTPSPRTTIASFHVPRSRSAASPHMAMRGGHGLSPMQTKSPPSVDPTYKRLDRADRINRRRQAAAHAHATCGPSASTRGRQVRRQELLSLATDAMSSHDVIMTQENRDFLHDKMYQTN